MLALRFIRSGSHSPRSFARERVGNMRKVDGGPQLSQSISGNAAPYPGLRGASGRIAAALLAPCLVRRIIRERLAGFFACPHSSRYRLDGSDISNHRWRARIIRWRDIISGHRCGRDMADYRRIRCTNSDPVGTRARIADWGSQRIVDRIFRITLHSGDARCRCNFHGVRASTLQRRLCCATRGPAENIAGNAGRRNLDLASVSDRRHLYRRRRDTPNTIWARYPIDWNRSRADSATSVAILGLCFRWPRRSDRRSLPSGRGWFCRRCSRRTLPSRDSCGRCSRRKRSRT
jgi:hypothetical protein